METEKLLAEGPNVKPAQEPDLVTLK